MLCNFSVRTLQYLKEKYIFFFATQKVEKTTPKSCILMATDKRTDVWSRPSCIYTQIFSPKKTGFSTIKNIFQNIFDFCLPLFYANVQY